MTVRANNTHIIFPDATSQNSGPVSLVNVTSTGSSIIPFYPTGIPWQVNTAIFISNANYGIAGDNYQGMFWKPDGTRVFSVGSTADRVKEHNLGTPWVLNTASHTASANLSISSQETNPSGLFFHPDGNRMFIVGSTSDRVWQYELSTPWQVNTGSHAAGANVSVASEDNNPKGLVFNNTGSKMYIAGAQRSTIFEYTLSTPWQVNTASISANLSLAPAQAASVGALSFSANGHKLYVSCSNSVLMPAQIKQYNCSTAYRINNATLEYTYNVAPLYETGNPIGGVLSVSGMTFRPEGNTMYTCTANNMMEYDMDPRTLRLKTIQILGRPSSSNATHISMT